MDPNLRRLEAEAVYILREAVGQFANPVLLYSIGKDSSVLLHLSRKAFAPAPVPFPLLHIDTTWKFRDMIAFRDATAARLGLNLIVHTNAEAIAGGALPYGPSSTHYTDLMKTVALRQSLDSHRFDAAIGGARRDEERSRAKERVFSVRSTGHRWDPKRQQPELWDTHNGRLADGETMRVFPLSNWTEHDVWHYIRAEAIPVVPLYFAAPRPVVVRQGALIVVDDERLPLLPGEQPRMEMVRFRTLGCYPLTGAIRSEACTIDDVCAELSRARLSERQGRLIDHDAAASMEHKKVEGYF
jgi:sulfate adenylyltransferase subunit 2